MASFWLNYLCKERVSPNSDTANSLLPLTVALPRSTFRGSAISCCFPGPIAWRQAFPGVCEPVIGKSQCKVGAGGGVESRVNVGKVLVGF